ncbi:MAG: YceD family protein [Gammaproteobacteria bacterium]|jgi:uncharacterized protein
MLKTKLPRTIDLAKFAEQRGYLEGILALADMPRLREICSAKQNLGEAKVIVEGGIDQQGLYYLKGHVIADVPLQCQRCLQAMVTHLDIKFLLSPVRDDREAAQLPQVYEALYLTQVEVDLSTIIEDELLLALPLVPKHNAKDCATAIQGTADMNEEKRPHPFAKLAELKKRKKRG